MPKMNPIVEEVIRKSLEKPEGELTEADLEKVMELSLEDPEITEESLEGMAKLTQFHMLLLVGTKTTDVDLKGVGKAPAALLACLGWHQYNRHGHQGCGQTQAACVPLLRWVFIPELRYQRTSLLRQN